jgi:hypothetical protein
MATDDKKTESRRAPKDEAVGKKEDPAKKKDESQSKDKIASGAEVSGAERGEKAAGYSRGEGQKPVSKAYKANWNAIYAKKKKR